MKTQHASVAAYMEALEPETAATVNVLREAILAASPELEEQLKWNSPAYRYTGPLRDEDPKKYPRDIAVFNVMKGRILLVLPTGARIQGHDSLLDKPLPDGRRMMRVAGLADAQAKAGALQAVIRAWLETVER